MDETLQYKNKERRTGVLFRRLVVVVLLFCLVAGTAVMVFFGLHYVGAALTEQNGRSYFPFVATAYFVAFAGAEYIGITLLVMMLTLEKDPFVKKNVMRLRAMGFVALVIAVAMLLLLFAPYNAWIFIIGGVLTGLCGLLSLVMAELFDRAVDYKQENDLTV